MTINYYDQLINKINLSDNFPPNIAVYTLDNIQKNFKEYIPTKSIIKQASNLFLLDLIKYSRNGGDIKKLTASNVYNFLNNMNKSLNNNNSLLQVGG